MVNRRIEKTRSRSSERRPRARLKSKMCFSSVLFLIWSIHFHSIRHFLKELNARQVPFVEEPPPSVVILESKTCWSYQGWSQYFSNNTPVQSTNRTDQTSNGKQQLDLLLCYSSYDLDGRPHPVAQDMKKERDDDGRSAAQSRIWSGRIRNSSKLFVRERDDDNDGQIACPFIFVSFLWNQRKKIQASYSPT